MNTDSEWHPDYLRPPGRVFESDPRNQSTVRLDADSGAFRPIEIQDYHTELSRLRLSERVPEDVVVQLETAKNLYLYAYFVYRFYPIAEHQALTCLELALRERYGRDSNKSTRGRRTLRPLLRHAIESGDVRNGGFRRWHDAAAARARNRRDNEINEEMTAKGIRSMIVDDSDIEIQDVDMQWNFIKILEKDLPDLRNIYAHVLRFLSE